MGLQWAPPNETMFLNDLATMTYNVSTDSFGVHYVKPKQSEYIENQCVKIQGKYRGGLWIVHDILVGGTLCMVNPINRVKAFTNIFRFKSFSLGGIEKYITLALDPHSSVQYCEEGEAD